MFKIVTEDFLSLSTLSRTAGNCKKIILSFDFSAASSIKGVFVPRRYVSQFDAVGADSTDMSDFLSTAGQ